MIVTQEECCDKGIDKGGQQHAAGGAPNRRLEGVWGEGSGNRLAEVGPDRSLQGGGVTWMKKDARGRRW